jgi:hypothetical protein
MITKQNTRNRQFNIDRLLFAFCSHTVTNNECKQKHAQRKSNTVAKDDGTRANYDEAKAAHLTRSVTEHRDQSSASLCLDCSRLRIGAHIGKYAFDAIPRRTSNSLSKRKITRSDVSKQNKIEYTFI